MLLTVEACHSVRRNLDAPLVQFSLVQPLIALLGWGHLLRWFWYQLAEMYGLAQLGHLKQPKSPACLMNDELELLNSSLLNGSELSSLAKLQKRLT